MLSDSVAAVKCRPVLHCYVVTFFSSFGIMNCVWFTFENRVTLTLGGANVVVLFYSHRLTDSIKPRLLFSPFPG